MIPYNQRNYYKIFTGTNQTDGYDKVHLGYESSTNEIRFQKDRITYFHIPFFAESFSIHNSTLIADGALAGPIPAMADRVYKKLGNYGNTTPWGTNTQRNDGTWLCSWLYQKDRKTPPIWIDRYYNPGRLQYREALEGTANFTDYLKSDKMYYDQPSELLFEPEGYYFYYHHGEKSRANLIKTFAGNDKNRLRLSIENWAENTPDESIYANTIAVQNSQTGINSNWFETVKQEGYLDQNTLSFENNEYIDARVLYSNTYNLDREFSITAWINSSDWENATSTQLLGNYNNGGFSLNYNNLYYTPFFGVPETTYGHLFFFNQNGKVYSEKNIKPTNQTSGLTAVSINYNSNSEIVLLNSNNTLLKYNHLGDIVTTTKNNLGENIAIVGTPITSILDGDDNTTVLTTSATYVFDKDLILLSELQVLPLEPNNPTTCLAYNTEGVLIAELSCLDLKFDQNNNKWSIKNNFRLYYNDSLYESLQNIKCLALGIDPNDDLWVVTNSREIYIINTNTFEIINTISAGLLLTDDTTNSKNLSFIKSYDRATDAFSWYAVLYTSIEQTFYLLTIDGKTIKTIFLPEQLNILDPETATQDKNILSFNCRGDFTGYENKRIFNRIKYNNKPQIQFKVGITPPTTNLPTSTTTLSIPANNFTKNSWQLITVTVLNNVITIYLNGILIDSKTIPINYSIQYTYRNDLYIGTPNGKTENLNIELQTKNLIWNGKIGSMRVYDYALTEPFINFLVNEKIIVEDILWNIPTTSLQYVEVIERFFKHKLPGFKSQFFNIKIAGSNITDDNTRKVIEQNVRAAIEKIKPVHTELLKVKWID